MDHTFLRSAGSAKNRSVHSCWGAAWALVTLLRSYTALGSDEFCRDKKFAGWSVTGSERSSRPVARIKLGGGALNIKTPCPFSHSPFLHLRLPPIYLQPTFFLPFSSLFRESLPILLSYLSLHKEHSSNNFTLLLFPLLTTLRFSSLQYHIPHESPLLPPPPF